MAAPAMDLSFMSDRFNSRKVSMDLGLNANSATPLSELVQPTRFELPATQEDQDKLADTNKTNNQYEHPLNPAIKMSHGTTTLGFVFDGGVLLAVDSRASMGSYINSGAVKKVIKISKYLLGTMAGGAADCSYWERNLAFQTRVHELREGKRISVAAASKLLANTVYNYRNYGLSMGVNVAGWDEELGPSLYYIDNDGTRLKGDMFSCGSGSTYAYGVLDTEYRKDLTIPEAIALGKKAIYHATNRDAYSGAIINVFCITADGWTQHECVDMNDLHYGEYGKTS